MMRLSSFDEKGLLPVKFLILSAGENPGHYFCTGKKNFRNVFISETFSFENPDVFSPKTRTNQGMIPGSPA
jgi:hypothetical protein